MSETPSIEPKVSNATLTAALQARGFKQLHQIIHLFAGGSHQHGARLPGKADLDVCGIYVPNADKTLGIDIEEHFVSSTGVKHEKNTSEDTDFALYSLRRWAYLAAKGNPTVLSYLFMPPGESGVWREMIVPYRDIFLASAHTQAFLGYAGNQLKRLQGKLGAGKHGQRDDIQGYDTKAAMHMIRMMHECLELLTTGKMTFPRPEVDLLMEIRTGGWGQARVESYFFALQDEVRARELDSVLPRDIDRGKISNLIAQAYLRHWER